MTRYFGEQLSGRLSSEVATDAGPMVQNVLAVARQRAQLEKTEESELARLRATGLPLLLVPERSPGPARLGELDSLISGRIFDQN
jgi:hypothetical protein